LTQTIPNNDVLKRPAPDAVRMAGLLGERFENSRTNRLIHQEEDHLLYPFTLHCPVGMNHPDRPVKAIFGDWQGEYLGTWMDAAALTVRYSGDAALRAKIDKMVDTWLATQEADGYLGTYNGDDRWKSWDIWIHGHDILGLVSYYHLTGDERILTAAVRAADCVMANFGPGKRFVYPTGLHGGMASSAILEPMIWLYFETGEERFLEWGKWLVDVDWEQSEGSHLVSILLNNGNVADIAGGKGIEMLTNLAGLVELYRATGESRYLQAVVNGWQDIVQHQLYLTGTSSSGEHFSRHYVLPNDGVYNVGETCVSMGWMYLNFSLARVTGDARYFDMAEQVIYNHLLTAQAPDGKGWAYYVGLRDHKRYRWHTEPECCPSRGVRALAQFPQHIYSLDARGVRVNLYEPGSLRFNAPDGQTVELEMQTSYPFDGAVTLQINTPDPSAFVLQLRIPGWCTDWQLQVNSAAQTVHPNDYGYVVLERTWSAGDRVTLLLDMPIHVVTDRLGNPGKVAFLRGPLVYAADNAYLEGKNLLDDVVVKVRDYHDVSLLADEASGHHHLLVPTLAFQTAVGASIWREGLRYSEFAAYETEPSAPVRLIPFFDAGNRDPYQYKDGIHPHWHDPARRVTYQVWLPIRQSD
jgi:uncharacterized protein